MVKKTIKVFACIVVLCLIIGSAGVVFAQSPVMEGAYSFDVENGEAALEEWNRLGYAEGKIVSWHNPYNEPLVIPSTYERCPVTTIKSNTFIDHDGILTEIVLPYTLTTIEDHGFSFLEALEKINIPNNVQTIGDSAFFHCFSLKQIELPDHIEKISNSCFSNCYALTEFSIPASTTTIGDRAFYACKALKNVHMSNSVEVMEAYAFSQCTSLTSFTIPENVTTINDGMFWGCSSMTEIVIPAGVTTIARDVFRECTSLTSVRYLGTKEQWNAIEIDENGNETLLELMPQSKSNQKSNQENETDSFPIIPTILTVAIVGGFVGYWIKKYTRKTPVTEE